MFLEAYNYDVWFESEESSDTLKTYNKSDGLSAMPPLEGEEEEVKEGKGLRIVTPNKLLTKCSILLAVIKAGKNSCKLKNKIRQILYLL